jgi:hypothetical protein
MLKSWAEYVLFISCCTSKNVNPALGTYLHRSDKVLLLQFHGPNDGAVGIKICIAVHIQRFNISWFML